jgi:hypothetical protein
MGMAELLAHQTQHVADAVEQAGDHHVARQALLRQLTQRRRHDMRIAPALGAQHLEQAEIARGPGRMNCSSRGRVRGTMIAFLSKLRISQNVL